MSTSFDSPTSPNYEQEQQQEREHDADDAHESAQDKNAVPAAKRFADIFGGESSDDEDLKNDYVDTSSDDSDEERDGRQKNKKKSGARTLYDPSSDSSEEAADQPNSRQDVQDIEYLPKIKKRPGSAKVVRRKEKRKERADAGDSEDGDEAPRGETGKKKKRKRRASKDETAQETQQPLTEQERKRLEANNIFENALQSIKSGTKRRKKNDVQTETAIDDFLGSFFKRMRKAADTDQDSNRNRQPAIAKLMMLDEVKSSLFKPALYESIVENEGLTAIANWLEPLSGDASLPALDIQRALFELLAELPIQTDNLRSSGIGRLIMFYTKCSRVHPDIHQLATELVNKWVRIVIGRRTKRPNTTNGESFSRPTYSQSQSQQSDSHANEDEDGVTHRPGALMRSFEVVPESKIHSKGRPSKGRPVNDRFKRLSAAMGKKGK